MSQAAERMPRLRPLPRLWLAPLAGISDWPFRLICGELGAEACVTEMISAQGYLTAPRDSRAYRDILSRHPGERLLSAQLFGHEPRFFAEALKRLSEDERFQAFDLNMGCPAPKVTGSGSGSALMKETQLARAIMRAARSATDKPLSVKFRLGWDEHSLNAVLFARMAEEEGLDFVTVHGRTRAQHYAGKADWQQIALVREAVRIPVIANGDVFTAQDALDILSVTGCAGLAVGRGALGNPWLFRQIRQALAGEPYCKPARHEVLALALRHARLLSDWQGERHAVLEMRKHFAWYLKGMHGAAELRRRINVLDQLAQVEEALCAFFEQASD